MPTFLQGRRAVLIALVVTSLALITFDLRGSSLIDRARNVSVDILAPVRGLVSAAFSPLRRAWHGIADYESVKDENDRLRQLVDEQEGDSIEAEAQIRDYEELRAFNSLPVRSDIPTVVAEVVGDPPQNFEQQTVEINQGSSKGIQVGMAVITQAGLVGRILRVTPNRAVVRLITDPQFTAGVKVAPAPQPVAPPATPTETTAAPPPDPATTAPPVTAGPPATAPPATTVEGQTERGLLEGAGYGRLPSIGLIDLDAQVNENDPVVTSGIRESLFPPDIPVGRVSEVKRTPGSLQLDVRVEPAADLGKLQFVAVLRYKPAE